MPAIDFQKNFFALFGLPEAFRLDTSRLELQYHALQQQVHPDKSAHLPEAEQRLAMQWATRVNEAYQILKSPLARARYLLSLNGVDTQEETNTAMPRNFLVAQLEWREAVERAQQAGDVEELDSLAAHLDRETSGLLEKLAAEIDDAHNYDEAAGTVRKLKFYERLAEEIDSALDMLDN